jgi:DNA polymerase-3 subunit alpha
MPRITSQHPVADSGLSATTSREVFDQIDRFAGYGFNKSHAAAYAAISFQTAWLKTHYPECFFAAAMNLDLDSVEDVAQFADSLKTRGVPFWTPSINQSRARFTPLKLKTTHKGFGHGIAYALSAIRGVGVSVAEAVEAERKRGGAFRDFGDFTDRMNGAVNRTALRGLAKAGAFDVFGLSRSDALAHAEDRAASAPTGQMSMFDAMGADVETAAPALSEDTVLDNEFSVLGHYMSAHPLDTMPRGSEDAVFRDSVLDAARPPRKAVMGAVVTKVDVRRTNAGDVMAVATLSDPDGLYEALAFGESWDSLRHSVKKGARLRAEVSVSQRGSERRIILERVSPLACEIDQAA